MTSVFLVSFSYGGRIPQAYADCDTKTIIQHYKNTRINVHLFNDSMYIDKETFMRTMKTFAIRPQLPKRYTRKNTLTDSFRKAIFRNPHDCCNADYWPSNIMYYFLGHGERSGFLLPDGLCRWEDILEPIDKPGNTIVLDCCYSGSAIKHIHHAAVLASCDDEQKSILVSAEKGSLFTYCLFSGRYPEISNFAASVGKQQRPRHKGMPFDEPWAKRIANIPRRYR